jgi:hypothetical protein
MPVIVREKLEIDDAKAEFLKVYKPDNHRLTAKEKDTADALDRSIEKEIEEIKKETKKLGLLKSSTTGKNDIKFWYEVGFRLNTFLKNNKISKLELRYFFDSVAQHAEKHDLFVGTKERRNNFDYASRIATHAKDSAIHMNWGIWTHIYDSTLTKEDARIGEWIIDKLMQMDGDIRDWFRGYFKELNATLKNYDTTVLSDQEIVESLEDIKKKYDVMHQNQTLQTKELIERRTK